MQSEMVTILKTFRNIFILHFLEEVLWNNDAFFIVLYYIYYV